ncbi:flagella synthesis protein FlgN [Legionella waltersii]|uniref:Flagellar biosynthesis/type III secretory pathway chaperone n=1 Tax=Legionella waltersii TaxID=66969 RepID=A0A0W1ANR8_9GAMM|nr:flagellar protein FlgN [Legionella waltersii]KTD82896.1 flagellar biosynthesis/type III secretory pathway chaperone [Legionella waltersii]SNV02172.1 flagella synthesis protein FlgN [Legionella waltersii]
MKNNNKAKQLIEHLDQEINWVNDLNALLAEEKIVLATRKFDQLEDLAEKKQTLTLKLEESAKNRSTLMNLSPNSQNSAKESLQEFLKACSTDETTQINSLNSKLAEKLDLCRELNTVNGQVIANNIYTRQQIINALAGNKVDATEVYNANGGIDKPSDNSHHQKA